MASLISFDPLTVLTVCFALGIWFVFDRYQHVKNRALPFHWPAPEASFVSWSSTPIKAPSLFSHRTDTSLLPPSYSDSHQYLTCYDPATALHIATIRADSESDIARKIETAHRAQDNWRSSTWADRRRVIRSFMAWCVREQETCARVCCRDTGKTMVDAALGEILTTCSKMDWILKHGEKALRPSKRHTNLLLAYKSSEVHYDPKGVVAAVVSWNYPMHNLLSPILAAIFAGNSIVVKCSEHVAWSSQWFVGAIRECIAACGWDPEIVQLVICLPEQAEALTTSPLIKHITFIGSETVGRKERLANVAQAATVHLTPCNIELGGKDPCIILPGTDIEQWSSIWMRGVFQGMGQNCIGIERFIVPRNMHATFLSHMQRRIMKLRLGSVLTSAQPGTEFVTVVDGGSMISDARFTELERLVKSAVADGATLVCGGETWRHAYAEDGAYFQPTLLGNVSEGMEIAQEEVFAPIMLVMPYDNVNEAIDIANGTKYGLGASIFGPDQRLCKNVALELECGMVAVNDFGVFYLNQDLPFGGIKKSGYGRFGGPEGLRALTNPKAVTVDRFPWLVRTSIPSVLDYPIRSLAHSWDFIGGLIAFAYAESWRARGAGLLKLIRAGAR